MDKCLHVLLKYAWDKGFERLVKLEKGNFSGRLTTILQRHLTSNKLSLDSVNKTGESSWLVQSSDERHDYTVVREAEVCPVNCCDAQIVTCAFPFMQLHGLPHP